MVVYGVVKDELFSDDEMIIVKVPGMTIGSDQDVYSCGFGYLNFVKGKHAEDEGSQERDICDADVDLLH